MKRFSADFKFHLWESLAHKPCLLCPQAKAKEKTYEFRRENPRGIQVSYPIPEPVITPRAREGLRTVVPTIFPPSAVNRGESVHVRVPEPERRPRATPPAALTLQESLRFPKKRGRKPKLHLHYDKDDESSPAEPGPKRSRLPEEQVSFGLSKESRRLLHHGETSERSLIQLTKRFQAETTITPKSCVVPRHAGSASPSYTCAFSPDVRRSAQGSHRTQCTSRMPVPQPSKLKLSAEPRSRQVTERRLTGEQPAVHDPATHWSPSFTNLDSVTVTDVTMNFLTVTIKESSTDKGFFREKR